MFRPRTSFAAGALLLAASLGLTACSDSGSGDEGAEAKTLTLWHYEGPTSAMGVAWNRAIELFKASHPGVEVKFEEKSFEQIQQNAGMILNSDSAPDILEYNKGNATAGLLSKQGLLTDLTEQAGKRGWDKALSPSLQTTTRYDDDGIMGSGKIFGIPNYGEYVMVYYNKDLFAKHKVAVPTTLAEFETALGTFTKAGVTPLSVGGAEYPAQQILYELALSKANRAFVDDYQLYKNKVDFHGPELTFGAQAFADWVAKGYIAKNSAGIKAEDMGVAFTQGKFPILISGSWWYGRFATEIKNFQWGTFLFPGNTLHPGSSGNLWVVPTKSKAKSLAYDFIDITMQPEVQALLGNSGGVPVAADPSKITDEKNKELIANFATISSSDGLAFYPDWPAPGYYDVLVGGVQGLINGSKTPEKMLDEIAKPYNDNLADLGK
ncbi:extracellular solute-binding protein [Amorphoplanes digitatis]|uniref:Raffinose/stachyose/melibiose transport system substrate-binding protein n=1 Tax=Actinoplanes digitatis TaxID=1868 RepID=A0A7W7HYI5_9ACTN|nr:extracellular solute-binding protein [Actinoplanes digitatis]MBB4763142.1 raffinose/stachyose/melibiose transport system substrate-binding protein [Actinoplanes digitatis]GID91960.1 sugar ABC transporter substrate-binding protein [Actinoplanes digitatis]